MERDFSDIIKTVINGFKPIENPTNCNSYGLGEKILLILNGEGERVKGGRMPYLLRQGIIESRHVRKKGRGYSKGLEYAAIRLRLTHIGTENTGLFEKTSKRSETYSYDSIANAYRVR